MTVLTHLNIIRENLLDQLKKHTSMPDTNPGNKVMPSTLNLASDLLTFFHYEIFGFPCYPLYAVLTLHYTGFLLPSFSRMKHAYQFYMAR